MRHAAQSGSGKGPKLGRVRMAMGRLLRVALAAAVCLALFAILPMVHRLADSDAPADPAAVVVTPSSVVRYRDRQQESRSVSRVHRRTIQARLGGKRGRIPDLSFTPDLSVGGGTGVAVEDVDLATFVFEEGKTDQPVVPLSRPLPPYPRRARDQGIEGTVLVELEVDRDGRVRRVFIRSLPHPAFRDVVLKTVRGWRFKPAVHKGVPVNVRVRVPIEFSLGS